MIEAIGGGIAAPACVAAGVAWLALLVTSGRRAAAGRCLAAAGPACGFLAGYALAIDAEWVPERNWHWLPYLAIAAALVGTIAAIRDPSTEQERPTTLSRVLTFAVPLLFLMLATACSAALVPKWTNRSIQVPGFACLLFLLLLLFDPLPQRVAPRRLLPLLYLSAFATAVFVAAKVSLTYAQLAGLGAAAFAGCSLVFWMRGEAAGLRGLLPAYVILLQGAAYVACIYPDDPIYGLLIPPAAPLVLWACHAAPLSRLEGVKRSLCEYGAVLLVLIGTAVALFAGSSGEGGDW